MIEAGDKKNTLLQEKKQIQQQHGNLHNHRLKLSEEVEAEKKKNEALLQQLSKVEEQERLERTRTKDFIQELEKKHEVMQKSIDEHFFYFQSIEKDQQSIQNYISLKRGNIAYLMELFEEKEMQLKSLQQASFLQR